MRSQFSQQSAAYRSLPRNLAAGAPYTQQKPQHPSGLRATRQSLSGKLRQLHYTPTSSSLKSALTLTACRSDQVANCLPCCSRDCDTANQHRQHSSRNTSAGALPQDGCRAGVLHYTVARSQSTRYQTRAAVTAADNGQSATHTNGNAGSSEQASALPQSSAAVGAQSTSAAGSSEGNGSGRDSGSGDGGGSGDGSSSAGGSDGYPKFPAWYTVWVWCTALLYLIWRWQWRRDRRLAAEQFEREQAAEEQLEQDWQTFAQRYKTQVKATTAAAGRGVG